MGTSILARPDAIAALQQRLLGWYAKNRRDLPWRDSDDPYQVWLSEIMLQQTRVEQMSSYFERFLRRFPSVQALAAATLDDVLKEWEGLGYYSRARNMHHAARIVVEQHGGSLPDTLDGLTSLPGIGPYTGAAVASIAFDRDHAVLDGNVTRVLCRLLRVEEDPARAAVKTELLAAAQRVLPAGTSGDFNQAMMELGARVCTPRNPGCACCPVAPLCRARAELEDPAVLPKRPGRREKPHYQVTAGLIRRAGELLIAQRPADGMLGGLWEFPGGKQEAGESLQECLAREIAEELDFEIEVENHVISVDHAYTHFSITLHAFRARYRRGTPRALGCADFRWVGPSALRAFAFPRTDRRIVEYLEQHPDHCGAFADE